MKIGNCMIPAFVVCGLLAACNSTSSRDSSSIKGPVSKEVVRGEARLRADSHTNLGFAYYAQNQYGTALQEAKVAIENDANFSPAYNLLGLIYKELGENKSAEEAFQRAMQISPGDPEVANNFGWFLCQTKREQQSFKYFDTALQNPLYPTPVVALANSAECAMQIKDFQGAEKYLNRALVIGPNNVRLLTTAANLKYLTQQYQVARFYILEVHKNAEPNASSAWLALRIARRLGNREDEARYQSLLRKKFPDSEEYKKLIQGMVE